MIITESFLEQSFNSSYFTLSKERTKRQTANESFNLGHSKDKPIVFLSHKHDEIKPLEQTIELIKSCGVDVYIDWMDEGMPKKTCSKTAERIKNKIEKCDKFILVGTEGAINSKWCNWELGIGDVHKSKKDNLAILPVKKNYEDYSGNEYIELYPTIQFENGNTNYIHKQQMDDVEIFVLPFPTLNETVKGKIPIGYYVQMQDEIGIVILIRFEEWLLSK